MIAEKVAERRKNRLRYSGLYFIVLLFVIALELIAVQLRKLSHGSRLVFYTYVFELGNCKNSANLKNWYEFRKEPKKVHNLLFSSRFHEIWYEVLVGGTFFCSRSTVRMVV